MSKKELWVRLKKYRFKNLVHPSLHDRILGAFGNEDSFTRAFAAKVAKKHGWTDEFAFLAIREYKKFVFLGATSHYEVTPSKTIDVVWHEHQLFTRGYREFCTDVLGRYFDHSPELIPFDEQTEVFNAQYEKTLAFYKREFGNEPPAEIWGKPKFDPKSIKGTLQKPERKKDASTRDSSDSDIPLYTMFSSSNDAAYAPIPVTFSGHDGTFAGAGATSSFSTPSVSHSAPADTGGGSHSCGSSSCSSSCGGGGCGS